MAPTQPSEDWHSAPGIRDALRPVARKVKSAQEADLVADLRRTRAGQRLSPWLSLFSGKSDLVPSPMEHKC
jgi:hypothetical protein